MLTFPLPLADFWSRLPISEPRFELNEAMVHSRMGNGAVLTADLGTRLWTGSVTLGRISYAEGDEVEALLGALRQAGRSFLANDPRRVFPKLDPQGVVLGAAQPTVHSIDVSGRSLVLAGLPAGYWLSQGDYLSIAVAGGGIAGLHRVVLGGLASATGITGDIEVAPQLSPLALTGAAVTLIRPACRMVLTPGSVDMGSNRRGITEGIRFDFTETRRTA